MKKQKKKKKNRMLTFTKIIVLIVIIMGVLDIQLSYVLAFLGKDNIAEALAVAIVTEIIGVTIGYCAKALFESHFEAIDNIKKKQAERGEDNEEEIDI